MLARSRGDAAAECRAKELLEQAEAPAGIEVDESYQEWSLFIERTWESEQGT